MDRWTPASAGTGFEFSPILQAAGAVPRLAGRRHESGAPRARLRHQPRRRTVVVAGRRAAEADGRPGLHAARHARSAGRRADRPGHDVPVPGAGDRGLHRPGRGVRARLQLRLHEHAQLADGDDAAADGDQPASRVRADVRRWRHAAKSGWRGCETDRSLLDFVAGRPAAARGRSRHRRPRPAGRIPEHMREIERRIQRAEQQSDTLLDVPDAPVGVPESFEEHVRLMFDLMTLAFQADITRVFTFMMSRELSQRTYPHLGVTEPHHSISHHGNRPGAIEGHAKVNTYHAKLFGDVRRAAAVDAGRRRLAARPLAAALRQRHGERQRALGRSAAAGARRQGGGRRQGQPPHRREGADAQRQRCWLPWPRCSAWRRTASAVTPAGFRCDPCPARLGVSCARRLRARQPERRAGQRARRRCPRARGGQTRRRDRRAAPRRAQGRCRCRRSRWHDGAALGRSRQPGRHGPCAAAGRRDRHRRQPLRGDGAASGGRERQRRGARPAARGRGRRQRRRPARAKRC